MHQEPCQDSTCPKSLFLEFWRTIWFILYYIYIIHQAQTLSRLHLSSKSLPEVWENISVPNIPVNGVRYEGLSFEASVKLSSRLVSPPSPILESRRKCRFLMNLELVSDNREYSFEASVKVSSRFDFLSRLHLSSKSLPGVWQDIYFPDEPGNGVR